MDYVKTGGFKLIGKKLPGQTTNQGGQSTIDCGNLWQQFITGNVKNNIPGKISDDIFAVYFGYEGDHTKPFSFFIGCKVGIDTRTPQGMDGLFIPSENYYRFLAKGKLPDCVANTWKEIWTLDIGRAYKYDFEVYGERSQNWNDAEVEIYLSSDDINRT